MKRYEVIFYTTRQINVTVDVPDDEDPLAYAWDEVELAPNEEVVETDCCEVDPNES
jgi:hypothetical protein